jgi:hypothetical protein
MVNRETRRGPAPPDASFYWLERSRPPGELSGMRYSHKQPWARSTYPPGQTDPHPGIKEKKTKLNNSNNKAGVVTPTQQPWNRKACNSDCHEEGSSREQGRGTSHVICK